MVRALHTLAGLTTADRFGELVQSIQIDRMRLAAALRLGEDLERAQRRVLGVTAADDAACLEIAVKWQGETALRDAATIVSRQGTKTIDRPSRGDPGVAVAWIPRPGWNTGPMDPTVPESRRRRSPYARLCRRPQPLASNSPNSVDRYQEEAQRILRIEDDRRALRLAAVSAALATLAGPVAEAYEQRKQHSGLLDYDDLIDRTKGLLLDPGVAWVLYKLDGGLDHLLLDEVQDTSPQQWEIAHTLTERVLQLAPRRARTSAPSSPSATASSRSTPSRAPTRPNSTAPATGSRGGCSSPASTFKPVEPGRVVPLHRAGAGPGGRGVRRSAGGTGRGRRRGKR